MNIIIRGPNLKVISSSQYSLKFCIIKFFSSSLPETQGRELMQTLEETEEFFQVKKRRSTPTDTSREDVVLNHLNKL